ncbi:PAS domain-containing protein [Candidatus Poribacteria bacterium]|jgi:two-component system, OmpR family, phosphate regulon sensor histidine kinase PhoR|nr:PAS domain-containing protein [Candidatus Poribacteria bacterium]MBT5535291.1 PAS domain-containing protein [Candidatus Poribacteria bacterium]MBT7100786.1 PAS domain-containing protein [Candidatus Poribacteria bacterium]MBT7805535.1 PAS domain-containing protein [Candidatus Poribacteria bacterium]
MLRSRFFLKVYAVYVGLILLAIAVVGALVAQKVEQRAQESIQQYLADQAALVRELSSPAFGRSSSPSLHDRLRALGGSIGARLTVIRADGVVIADSQESPSAMDNHARRPEVLVALSEGYGTATRFSETVGATMMYVALSVREGGQLLGYVRASLPLAAIEKQTDSLRAIVGLGGGVAALVALPLGLFLARRLVRPLTLMTAVAESMVQGNYDERLDITGKDEVGQLAHTLNRMAESARDRVEAISTDRNKLLTILGSMVEGVIAVDRDGIVLHMNAGAARLLAAEAEECLGKGIREVTRVHDIRDAIDKAMREGTEVQGELRLATLQSHRVVEMRASPLRNGEGTLVGAVVVLDDVSALRRLETVRRDFVMNMSHELKTPITAIRMLAETLIGDKKMGSKTRKRFLSKIRDQSTRLSSIVTDLLALARLESENAVLDTELVDLRDVVLTSIRPLLPDTAEEGPTVTTVAPDAPISVLGDDEALGQATRNLLENALKYTPNDGRVWVRLRSEEGRAVVEVEDTGIGIAPRDQLRIFERFYRVDKARSRELGGTGLGLSIVKHIALAHEGTVTVESRVGDGATFRLVLPLASSPA